jgi:hypothetical protein
LPVSEALVQRAQRYLNNDNQLRWSIAKPIGKWIFLLIVGVNDFGAKKEIYFGEKHVKQDDYQKERPLRAFDGINIRPR